jgi:hypothetical protein
MELDDTDQEDTKRQPLVLTVLICSDSSTSELVSFCTTYGMER